MDNNEYKNTENEERKSELNAYETGRRNETGLEPVFSSSEREREYQNKSSDISVNTEASSSDNTQSNIYSGYNQTSNGYPGYGNYQNMGSSPSPYQAYSNPYYMPRNNTSSGQIPQTPGAYQMHNTQQRAATDYQNYSQPVKPQQTKKKSGSSADADITAEEFKSWVTAKWNIPPETRMKEYGHPAMFPEHLAERVLKLFSFKNDIVLDPFNGAGTTTAAAKKTNRHFSAGRSDTRWLTE